MRAVLTLALVLVTASAAIAQPPKFELIGSMSWVLADGISFSGRQVDFPDGSSQIFNRIEPEDGVSYGLGLGVYANRNVEVAFLWDHHVSELTLSGQPNTLPPISTTMKISDMNINSYHGVVIYNWGSYLDTIRPFLYGGLGSTVYGGINFEDLNGNPRSTNSKGKFSSTWGAGVKYYPTRNFGIQAHIKWTPTYIKSDPNGYWCDPYWGCYQSSSADYSNQWAFGGALLARF
jgi:opacity protein-like surface antigen